MKRASLFVLTAFAACSQATLVYQTGFESTESPAWALGSIQNAGVGSGQNGWFSAMPLSGNSAWNILQNAGVGPGNMLMRDTTVTNVGAYVYRPVTFTPSPTGDRIAVCSFDIYMETVAEGIPFHFLESGVDAYGTGFGEGGFVGQMTTDNREGWVKLKRTGLGGTTEVLAPNTITRNAWHRFEFIVDFRNGLLRGKVDGQDIGVTLPTAGTDIGEFDLYSQRTVLAFQARAYFDNYKIESFRSTGVSGTLTIQDYSPSLVGKSVNINFRRPSDNAVMDSTSSVLTAAGEYSLSTSLPNGTYDVYANFGTHLSEKLGTVVMTGADIASLNGTLLNGDWNNDDVVDLTDYTAVAVAFNALPASPNWDANADLNGDQVVDLTDYTIIAVNFNRLGEEPQS